MGECTYSFGLFSDQVESHAHNPFYAHMIILYHSFFVDGSNALSGTTVAPACVKHLHSYPSPHGTNPILIVKTLNDFRALFF